ncbi:DHHC palmitoyltransferase-domain-containing protein [Umbelopsis sp. PMI_123]|nr:DHHC palmitoyltransferase-domain-containing protein [Umbelopsis sp. PMI_123]
MLKDCLPGRLIVLTVITVIGFIGISAQITCYQQLFQSANSYTLAVFVPLNAIIIMLLINYALVCNTDPGAVPINWVPPTQQPSFEVKRSNYEPRFCRTCENYKPARSHHCSTCKRCVLKMDHHCPWINNCVGYANYGHFIRFLFYVNIANVYIIVLLSFSIVDMIKNMHEHPIVLSRLAIIGIDLFLDLPVTVAVAVLSGYHTYCLATNTTTIEGWERGQTVTVKYKGKIRKIKHPYNTGKINNIRAVLGPNAFLWFVPQQMIGDGLMFPINPKFSLVEEEIAIFTTIPSDLSTTTLNAPQDTHINTHEKHHHPFSDSQASPPSPVPLTPASVRTFASSSTLVDHRAHEPVSDDYELVNMY